MNIPEVIRSISEILTTSEELMEEGDAHNVALILTSFLKTLMADLDKLYVEQGSRNVLLNGLGEEVKPAMTKAAPRQPGTPPPGTRVKRAIRNKYAGKCVICGDYMEEGQGFVVPLDKPEPGGKKKWWTYCPTHYQTEAP